MSATNVEILKRAMDAFDRGEVDQALQYAHPEVITRRIHPLSDAGEYKGAQGFLQAIAEWTEGFGEFKFEAEDFVDSGDRVVVRVHQWARGEASGVAVEGMFWFVFALAGGKIVRLDMYASEEQALAESGLKKAHD